MPSLTFAATLKLEDANPIMISEILNQADQSLQPQEFPTDWDMLKFMTTGNAFNYGSNFVIIHDGYLEPGFVDESRLQNIYDETRVGFVVSLESQESVQHFMKSLGIRVLAGLTTPASQVSSSEFAPVQFKSLMTIPLIENRLLWHLHAYHEIQQANWLWQYDQKLTYHLRDKLFAVAQLNYSAWDRPSLHPPYFGLELNGEF
jgi:hypothetical protein